jgi:NADH-quinone oxidoreductase subunit A
MNDIDPRWGWLALTEMFLFLGILILGLAYVWVKGDLDWIKPKPIVPITDVHIPSSLYDKLNTEQSAYKVKEFTIETQADVPGTTPAPATAATPPIRKPMFKPTFKKPGNE